MKNLRFCKRFRYALCLSLLSFFVLPLSGQIKFLEDSTVWYFVGAGPAPDIQNYYEQEIIGDSLYNGLIYKKITDSGIHEVSDAGLAREDSLGRVYFIPKDSTEEFLIYDFSLQPGEEFVPNEWILNNNTNSFDTAFLVIGYFEMVSPLGDTLEVQRIDGDLYGRSPVRGIGARYGSFTLPFTFFPFSEGEVGPYCIVVNGEAKYAQYESACSGLDALVETEEHKLKVYPNPSHSGFWISELPRGYERYEIIGMKGQELESGSISPYQMVGEELEAGIYILSLIGEKQRIHRKIIRL